MFIEKLRQMGHEVITSIDTEHNIINPGITFKAVNIPRQLLSKQVPILPFQPTFSHP